MPKIRNVSPRGALDVPLLGRDVDAAEEVDVSAEQATILLAQIDNWHPADQEALEILDGLDGLDDSEATVPLDDDLVDDSGLIDDHTTEGDAP